MEDVGESNNRNEEFKNKFNRDTIIKNLVKTNKPTILDIGAHHGQSVKYFKKLFPNSSIHSFEPDPDSFLILSNLKFDDLKLHNFAISNKVGKLSFFRNSISHTNSLNKVNINSTDSISISEAKQNNDIDFFNNFNKEIIVNSITLDEFANSEKFTNIDLLKIDVQGAEVKVLTGAVNILNTTRNIVLEISFFDYYESQSSFLAIEKIISPIGFKMFSISEISNNPMNGRTDWVEVIYQNTNFL